MSTKIARTIASVLAVSSGLVGCRSIPLEDKAPPVARLGVASSEVGLLETGREIYTGRCTKCHRPKPVQDYAAEDWSGRIIPKMAKKAKLSTVEAEAVLAYVLAARGTPAISIPR